MAVAVLTALVLEGYVYASLPLPSALLLAAAPGAAWLTRVSPSRRLGPWASAAIGVVVVFAPVCLAVGIAASLSPALDF